MKKTLLFLILGIALTASKITFSPSMNFNDLKFIDNGDNGEESEESEVPEEPSEEPSEEP